MSRRSILSPIERTRLPALPETRDDLIRCYTFNESDLSLIRQVHRQGILFREKRLGMAAGRSSPGMGRSSKALQVIGHHNVTKIIASFSLNIPTVIPAKKVGIQS
jgi:hypothetical protein